MSGSPRTPPSAPIPPGRDDPLRGRAEPAETLLAVSTALASSSDPISVLDAIVDAARTLTGAPRSAVLELDPDDHRLRVRAARGLQVDASKLSLAPGQGAAGSAALSRAPVFFADVTQQAIPLEADAVTDDGVSLREMLRRHGHRAMLAVPLMTDDAVLGAIVVSWTEPGASGDTATARLTSLARPGAAALARARAHEALRRRAEQQAALLRSARTMMAGLDTKAMLDHIVSEAAAFAGTPHVKLMLVDEAGRILRLGAVSGTPVPPDFSVALGASYSGTVALTGEPLYVADTQNDPRNPLAERDRETGMRTYLGVPVRIRDTVLGVLSFSTTHAVRYTPDELAYLSSFADQAAIALDKARLYEDTQRALADARALQQQLVQGETLRAVGELAGGAAHHLNNLLTIVVGRVQLLSRLVEDERVRRPLEIIERAAKDGAEVVRRLQQFSGMRRIAQPRVVDLNQVVTDVLEMTRGRWQDAARAQGVEIVVEPRLGTTPPVAGDATALRELVTNVVLNAVEAMPRGGRLVAETRGDGSAVVLSVADSGVGMSAEVQRRAREPFFTTKGVHATGLGLSVSHGIVRRHGGELSIVSAPERGTTVTIRLPVALAAAAAAAPVTAALTAARARRILLVDDEVDVRDALAEMLESQGHTVVLAGSGAEALDLLEREPALDLVLSDVEMPGMTGWELASVVKARRPRLAVGVLTGGSEPRDADRAQRQAADFVIGKPVTLEGLAQVLARLQ